MALLVSFFVMLVAFSTQDSVKLQVVAGSMREAFGVQDKVRYSGIIEMPGLPTRPKLKNAAPIPPEEASANPTEDERGSQQSQGGRFDNDRNFALAAASLRQALQDMPEISEVSKNIIIEETKQGLNIEIVDQNGRSMFPEGSREPYERTRVLIRRLAGSLRAMPFRLSISGHTSAIQAAGAAELRPLGIVGGSRQRGPQAARDRRRPEPRIFTWWRGGPTPSRCSRTIPISPPIAG